VKSIGGTVERLIMTTLNSLERDEAAKAAFLSRIPMRQVDVHVTIADRIAKAQQRVSFIKGVRIHGAGQKLVDDAINAAIDRAETKAARKAKR
jgi:hypothetical protein